MHCYVKDFSITILHLEPNGKSSDVNAHVVDGSPVVGGMTELVCMPLHEHGVMPDVVCGVAPIRKQRS